MCAVTGEDGPDHRELLDRAAHCFTYGGPFSTKMHECCDGEMKPLMHTKDGWHHEYFCPYCRQYTRLGVSTGLTVTHDH